MAKTGGMIALYLAEEAAILLKEERDLCCFVSISRILATLVTLYESQLILYIRYNEGFIVLFSNIRISTFEGI